MLHSLTLALGAICLIAGLATLAVGGFPPAFVFLCWGVLIVVGVVFERFRYKRLARAMPGPGWEKTSERFVDDETGKPVTVYIQPATGERTYVEE